MNKETKTVEIPANNFRLKHTVMYFKNMYHKSENCMEDICKCLHADGFDKQLTEHQVLDILYECMCEVNMCTKDVLLKIDSYHKIIEKHLSHIKSHEIKQIMAIMLLFDKNITISEDFIPDSNVLPINNE